MADTDETDSESVPSAASPDESAERDLSADLPGEMLTDDLVDPDDYQVAPDETEAEELDADSRDALDPDNVDERIAPLDFEVDDAEQLESAEAAAAVAKSSRPERRKRPVRKQVDDDDSDSPSSPDTPHEPPAGSRRPKRKQPSKADSSKGRKKKKKGKGKSRRTGPVQFTRESIAELRKVVWPTPPQLRQYFIVVLLFVLFIIAYVVLLDLGFGAGLLWLFGRQS